MHADRAGDRARWLDPLACWIAVAGGLGYAPIAPGTFGSAAGVVVFTAGFGLLTGASWIGGAGAPLASPLWIAGLVGGLCLGVSVLGVWASARAERVFGVEDDGRIVIDEVAGQLLALAPLPLLLEPPVDFSSLATGVVTGFVLFRVFDIAKPGAVRWAERRFDGGLGVMADDWVAGLCAAVVLVALGLGAGAALPDGGFFAGGGFLTGGGLFTGGGLSMGEGLSSMGGGLS